MFIKKIKCYFILFFLSFQLVAENVPEVEAPQINQYEQSINLISQEVKNLNSLQKEATGQDKLALQLYMFRKNVEIRKIIADAIAAPEVDKAFFIKQIKLQQKSAKSKLEYLSKRANELNDELNAAKNEDKLTIVTQYEEIRKYLDGTYVEKAENIAWLAKLEVKTHEQQQSFDSELLTRLEQISANIQFLKMKRENQSSQQQDAPEADKEGFSLALSITKRQMDIATSSLQAMMKLADLSAINTAEYKRLLFDVTGSVTQDLLNKDVLASIFNDWAEKSWAWVMNNTPGMFFQLLVVIIILLFTHQVARIFKKILAKMLSSKNLRVSQLMQEFFINMSGRIVWLLGLLIALAQIGINLGPVLAGFGIAGVIIGFALQDTLANFAAGMMLLIYRPFDVGDFVLAGGVEGKVSHMSLVNTTIKTFDNQIIIVPNNKIWGDVIKNVTQERVRRVDMEFGVSYNDDIEFVEKIFLDIITHHPAVLKSPEPMIKVGSLGDSSVNFLVRPWCKTDDYWDVYWDVTREVKIRFDKEGVSIPFPQQDVHFYHGTEKATYIKRPDNSSDEGKIVKQ